MDASDALAGHVVPVQTPHIINAAESMAKESHARESEVARVIDQTGGYAAGQGGTVVAQEGMPDPAYAVTAGKGERFGSGRDAQDTYVVEAVGGEVTHALTSEGGDASEDGTGRGTPIVAEKTWIDPLACGPHMALVGIGKSFVCPDCASVNLEQEGRWRQDPELAMEMLATVERELAPAHAAPVDFGGDY